MAKLKAEGEDKAAQAGEKVLTEAERAELARLFEANYEPLQKVGDRAQFPRPEMCRLLELSGFQKNGEFWHHASLGQLSIRVPEKYTHTDDKLSRKIGRALRALEDLKPRVQEETPPWAKDIVAEHPRFTVETHGGRLHVSAVDYPEYAFSVEMKNQKAAVGELRANLEVYDKAGMEGDQSLDKYIQLLKHAQDDLGFVRRAEGTMIQLSSALSKIEPMVLSAYPKQLVQTLEQDAIAPATEVYFNQQEYIAQQRALGFDMQEGKLGDRPAVILSHPRLREPLAIAAHGEFRLLDAAGVEKLNRAVAFVQSPEAEMSGDKGEITRFSNEEVAPPKKGQTTILLDRKGFRDLCAMRAGSGKDWTELLSETLALPSVGKLIITDEVADMMRGVARRYGKNDVPEQMDAVPLRLFADQDVTKKTRERAQKFLRKAVRRHEVDGKVEFLVEAGVNPLAANKDIVIWETAAGREQGEKLCALAATKDMSKDEDIKKIVKEYNGKQHAEEFCNLSLPADWQTPVAIISSDYKRLGSFITQWKTKNDQPKSYATTYHYLKEELAQRGDELKRKLNLQETGIDAIYERILGDLKLTEPYQDISKALGYEAVPINMVIRNGINERGELPKEVQAPAVPPKEESAPLIVIPPPAAPAAPAQGLYAPLEDDDDFELDTIPAPLLAQAVNFALNATAHARDCGLSNKQLAEMISVQCPHMPPIDHTIVNKLRTGKLEVEDDHLYAMMTVLVDQNPAIEPEDKAAARAELVLAGASNKAQHVRQVSHKPVDQDKYTRFGELIGDRMHELDLTDDKLARLVRQQMVALSPDEKKIDGHLIGEVLGGKTVPSRGLALGLRRALELSKAEAVVYDNLYVQLDYKPDSVGRGDLAELKAAVLAHFGGLKQTDIKEIGNKGETPPLIKSMQVLGLLFGKGEDTKFLPDNLIDIGVKLGEYVKAQGGDRAAFFRDFSKLANGLLRVQQQGIGRG